MHVSAAELETNIKTAVIGAGAPAGIGVEIGKAALAQAAAARIAKNKQNFENKTAKMRNCLTKFS